MTAFKSGASRPAEHTQAFGRWLEQWRRSASSGAPQAALFVALQGGMVTGRKTLDDSSTVPTGTGSDRPGSESEPGYSLPFRGSIL